MGTPPSWKAHREALAAAQVELVPLTVPGLGQEIQTADPVGGQPLLFQPCFRCSGALIYLGAEPSPGLSGIRNSLWGHSGLVTCTKLMFY